MILVIFVISLLVIWTLYQFERITLKYAIKSLLYIMITLVILGFIGFVNQTVVHTINGLLVFIVPILAVIGVYSTIKWIKSE